MIRSEQINELAAALSKAQGAMQNATMNKTNPHFKSKYADLSSVLDAMRGPLSANGLSVVQTMERDRENGSLVLQTVLMHSSGQFISTEYPLPNTQRAHEMGSALTYARRYSLAALICNASDEDDDGNAAMANGPAPKPNGGGPRQNPHVTRPEDVLDHTEQDVLPPPGDKQLSKAKANPIFKELQDSLWKCGTVAEMDKWSVDNKERIGELPGDWYMMLRGVYVEHKNAIIKQAEGDNLRMAG